MTMVSYKDIFPKTDYRYLPTYNKFAVQCYLDRVPHLSEHFIFMNEGMFFGAALSPWDFFTNTGLPKVGLRKRGLHSQHGCANRAFAPANGYTHFPAF